jgi:hypothetical protein
MQITEKSPPRSESFEVRNQRLKSLAEYVSGRNKKIGVD